MKKLLLLSAVAVLAAGCAANADDVEDSGRTAFRFTGSNAAFGDASSTRTVWTPGEGPMSVVWDEGDEVALFGAVSSGSIADNCPYRVVPDREDAAKCTFYPSQTSDMIPWVSDAAVRFYACYPYKAVEGAAPEAFPLALPAVQSQAAANDTRHLGRLCFMKANPVRVSTTVEEHATVDLAFHNVFSVVELSVRLAAGSVVDVPVKQLRIASKSGVPLAYPSAAIDLTTAVESGYERIPVTSGESSSEIRLFVESLATLTENEAAKFYFVTAPGEHADGEIELELVAIDNSTARVTLPGAVTFRSNRTYAKQIEVADADFVAANPFDVDRKQITATVGQPVVFDFTGMADRIVFYSGEPGRDHAYSDKDRMTRAGEMNLSFSMQTNTSGSSNGFNPRYAALAYSTDFDGTMDVERMNAATWTDISANFTLPTESKVLTESGIYDIASLFPEDRDDIYLRFDYQFLKGTDPLGRSIVSIKRFDITAELTGEEPWKAYSLSTVGWQPLLPDPNPGAAQVVLPGAELKFSTSGWKPAASGSAWAIARVSIHRYNRGRDEYALVKESVDVQPSSYCHVYCTPGTYRAVFVAKSQTLMGEQTKTIVVEVTVTE